MLVFKYKSKTNINVSQVISRTAGANNVALFDATGSLSASGNHRTGLQPTPLSILVALALHTSPEPVAAFPRTRELNPLEIVRRDEREVRAPFPPSANPIQPDHSHSHLDTEPTALHSPVGQNFPFDSTLLDILDLDLPDGENPSRRYFQRVKFDQSGRDVNPFDPPTSKVIASGKLQDGGLTVRSGRLWRVYNGMLDVSSNGPEGRVGPSPGDSQDVARYSVARTLFNDGEDTMSPAFYSTKTPDGSPRSTSHSSTSRSLTALDISDSSYSVSTPDTPPTPVSLRGRNMLPVVFKVGCPRHHRDLPSPLMHHGEYNPAEARAAILNEARMYEDSLVPMQHVAVPGFYGLYRDPASDMWIMVLENIEYAWSEHESFDEMTTRNK